VVLLLLPLALVPLLWLLVPSVAGLLVHGSCPAAAVARLIYLKKGLGVGALTRHFGGRHRKGTRMEKFRKSSAGLIRHVLQQLETIGTVVKW
jgi:hypothetical protein